MEFNLFDFIYLFLFVVGRLESRGAISIRIAGSQNSPKDPDGRNANHGR
jgi:hypothetical protein